MGIWGGSNICSRIPKWERLFPIIESLTPRSLDATLPFLSGVSLTQILCISRSDIHRCGWKPILRCSWSTVQTIWTWSRCLDCGCHTLHIVKWCATLLGWYDSCSHACVISWLSNHSFWFFFLQKHSKEYLMLFWRESLILTQIHGLWFLTVLKI